MKEVAIAILYQFPTEDAPQPKLLMQLRDPIPGIAYPGHWGLFGGHLEPNESPEEALRRELLEEIQYDAASLIYMGNYGDDQVHRHLFQGPLTVSLENLTLLEGWDMALLSWDEIKTGECYSHKAKQVKPVAVSYTHLRAHETVLDLVCRLLLEKKNRSRRSTMVRSITWH